MFVSDITLGMYSLAFIAVGVWAVILYLAKRRLKKWWKRRQAKQEDALREFVEDVAQQVLQDSKAVI